MFAAVELFKIAAGRGDLQSWRKTTLAVLAAAAVSSVLLDLVVHLRARRHRAALRLYFDSDCEHKVNVPASVVGKLIGPRGATLRLIEKQTKAFLDVGGRGNHNTSTSRLVLVTISGSRLRVAHAAIAVHSLLINATLSRLRRSVVVPRAAVGFVIGRRGESIRRIRESSNTRIVVSRCGDGDVETLTVIGAPDGIRVAEGIIKNKLEEFRMRDRENANREEDEDDEEEEVSFPLLDDGDGEY